MIPRRDEVKIDRLTQLLKPTRDASIYARDDHHNLASHGGAHRLGPLPAGLMVIQAGRDPSHFEVVPVFPMTFEDYETLLAQIALTPE